MRTLRRMISDVAMRNARQRIARARARTNHQQRSTIDVVLAAEERWLAGSSAVTTWVTEVYSRLGGQTTVWTAACRRSETQSSGSPSPAGSDISSPRATAPRWYHVASLALRLAAGTAAAVTGKSADNIYRLGIAEGRFWVWAIAPHLVGSSAIHVHNRPAYAAWLRHMGITEPIILHAHNDLVGSAQAAARSALTGASPAEIVAAADHIVFCSHYLRATAEAEFGPLPASVVHNGVSIDDRPQSAEPREEQSAMWAGRVVPEKGALEAASTLTLLKNTAWTLTMYGGAAGPGRSGYARRVAETVDAADNIETAGFLPHSELLAEYRRHAVFLYPCRWPEPFGMVLVEAMAGGAVVIAPRVGGIPEIIDDGRTGILLDADAPPQRYAEVLQGLDADRLTELRRAAADAVRERFTWDTVARRMELILSACIAERPPSEETAGNTPGANLHAEAVGRSE